MRTPWLPVILCVLTVSLTPGTEGQAQDMSSRFAAPASGPAAQGLAGEEARAIALARRTIAEMRALAQTPGERAVVQQDAQIVETVARLVATRASLRSRMATAAPSGTPGPRTGTGDRASDPLLSATRQMQETQMSFNLQVLQLQSQMQRENRSYTAVSNIMKTKHDTVKNSISNVR